MKRNFSQNFVFISTIFLLCSSFVAGHLAVANKQQPCNIFTPNVFSPNNDGKNDEFLAFTNCDLSNFHMQIFDRWGTMVFESMEINSGWNGTLDTRDLPQGVYTFQIKFAFLNADSTGNALIKSGDVTLIR